MGIRGPGRERRQAQCLLGPKLECSCALLVPVPAGRRAGHAFLFQLLWLHSFPTRVSQGLLGAIME